MSSKGVSFSCVIGYVWNPDIYARENSFLKSRGLQNVSGL